VPVIILVRFQLNVLFFYRFSIKILEYKISGKSVQWEANCAVRTDRHGEAKSRFPQSYESVSNGHSITDHESPREAGRYSSTHSLTSALDGVDG